MKDKGKGQAGGEPARKTVRVADVEAAPWNPRSAITEESVRELARSIGAEGLLQPVNVFDRTGRGGYVCFDGCRRLAACRALGMDEIPANVWDVTEDEAKVKTVTANVQRLDDDPVLAARVVSELLEGGADEGEIAAKLGQTVGWVRRRIRISKLTKGAEVLSGKVSIDALERLAALPDELQGKVVKTLEKRMEFAERITAREVGGIINAESTDLDEAPFVKADSAVERFRDGCEKCAKRTGAEQDLFGELPEGGLGRCLDGRCFRGKVRDWERRMLIDAGVPTNAETVRVQWEWQFPNHATGAKFSKATPCAFVWFNGPDLTVRWGKSKRQEAEERKREAEKRAEENAEENARRERAEKVVDAVREYISDPAHEEFACEKLGERKGGRAGNAGARLLVRWAYERLTDSYLDNEEWAEAMEAFPFLWEEAGVDGDEAEWFVGENGRK